MTSGEHWNLEYNPRLIVPNHEAIKAKWQASSVALRNKVPGQYDLPYGARALETLDILPGAQPNSPLLVFIHGGYWRALDKSDFTFIAPPLVEAGAAVALPNYDLLPHVGLATICDQLLAAVYWLFRHAERFNVDPNRIYLAGHSAGAHLTTLAMAASWPSWPGREPQHLVKGGLAISGVYDLRPLTKASFLSADLGLDEAEAASLSPALMPCPDGCRLMTSVGGEESDEFKRQNRLIAERWAEAFAGDVAMPGYNHFDIVDELANSKSPLFRAALDLMGL